MWSSIFNMHDQTLPANMLEAMREAPTIFSWYTLLLKLLHKYKINPTKFTTYQWRTKVCHNMEAHFWDTINNKRLWAPYSTDACMFFHSNISCTHRALLNQTYIEDRWSLTGSMLPNTLCPLCIILQTELEAYMS